MSKCIEPDIVLILNEGDIRPFVNEKFMLLTLKKNLILTFFSLNEVSWIHIYFIFNYSLPFHLQKIILLEVCII